MALLHMGKLLAELCCLDEAYSKRSTSINIQVLWIDGRTFPLKVKPQESIHALKVRIHNKLTEGRDKGVKACPDARRLFLETSDYYRGEGRGFTVCYAGIKEGDIIFVREFDANYTAKGAS